MRSVFSLLTRLEVDLGRSRSPDMIRRNRLKVDRSLWTPIVDIEIAVRINQRCIQKLSTNHFFIVRSTIADDIHPTNPWNPLPTPSEARSDSEFCKRVGDSPRLVGIDCSR